MPATFAPPSDANIPLHLIAEDALEGWLANQPVTARTWVDANVFAGRLGQALTIPDDMGRPALALVGYGSEASRMRGRFAWRMGSLSVRPPY